MAVVYDTSSAHTWDNTSYSTSYTTTSFDNRWMMVGIGTNQVASDGPDITSVKYNGVSFTEAWDSSIYTAGDWYHIWTWSLVAPATGSNIIEIVCVNSRYHMVVATASGVDQTNPTTATEQQQSSSSLYDITIASDANGLIVVHASGLIQWSSYGSGQTERQDTNGVAISTEAGTGSNVLVDANASGSVGSHAYAYSLQPVQNVAVTPTHAEIAASAHIGSVDDGNIALSNIVHAEMVGSAHIGAVQETQVILADMIIYT